MKNSVVIQDHFGCRVHSSNFELIRELLMRRYIRYCLLMFDRKIDIRARLLKIMNISYIYSAMEETSIYTFCLKFVVIYTKLIQIEKKISKKFLAKFV